MTTHQNVTGLSSGRESSRRASWHSGVQLWGHRPLCVCSGSSLAGGCCETRVPAPEVRCTEYRPASSTRVGLWGGRAPKRQERLVGVECGGELGLGASQPALSIPLGRKEGLGLASPHFYPLLSSVWSISGLPGNFSTSTPHPESKSIRVGEDPALNGCLKVESSKAVLPQEPQAKICHSSGRLGWGMGRGGGKVQACGV